MCKNVLIVDDVELSREILKNAISKIDCNININTAVNAYDALEKMLADNYDLVLMDIMMPNGDGFELLKMMSNKNINTKFIIISSLDKSIVSSVSMLGKLYSLNVVASLKKPIIADQISGLVEKTLTEESDLVEKISNGNKLDIFDTDKDYPITLVYQPQVISDIDVIVGFEVLSRWSDTDGSLLPPSFFLPMIEELGKQKLFTEIVIEKFIKDYNEYFFGIDKSIRFSINIEPNLLVDSSIVDTLMSLYDNGIEHTIVIELTEKNLSKAIEKELLASALRLRLKGFEISIDDFGMGASNIERVSNLPINEVKIDKELTWSFNHNTDVMEAIEKAKQLSAVKNARVVFEGVESIEIKESLEAIGGFHQQGFLYGVPLLPDVGVKLLERQASLQMKTPAMEK
ncbi:EAL domain-containing response regulator [Aliivibrio logei]|uniref:Diguanylate phosphodiesterase n=1 Tax=Aliivibrio logei 5S-186 TaxID=626086 RepID=A0ABX3AZZ8_ALILO|nr:EAL domain-containing protein [Aliivibrio logei]OEF22516.1 hypothetical protein A1Q5_15685 [Aliivibrio logei 5S-186]